MDPNQIEAWKDFLPQSTIEYLLNPTAETIGQSLDGIATALCWPLLKLRIIQKNKLKQFAEEIRNKNDQIPIENRDSSKIGLAIKAIEEARYQLNKDDIRKMFVNLISSTVDNRKNDTVTPRLATVVSQLGSDEASFLRTINEAVNHQIIYGYMSIKDNKDYSTRDLPDRFYNAGGNAYPLLDVASVNILESLGVIEVHEHSTLSSSIYTKHYKFIEDFLRSRVENINLSENEVFEFQHAYIRATKFGDHLLNCIFE